MKKTKERKVNKRRKI